MVQNPTRTRTFSCGLGNRGFTSTGFTGISLCPYWLSGLNWVWVPLWSPLQRPVLVQPMVLNQRAVLVLVQVCPSCRVLCWKLILQQKLQVREAWLQPVVRLTSDLCRVGWRRFFCSWRTYSLLPGSALRALRSSFCFRLRGTSAVNDSSESIRLFAASLPAPGWMMQDRFWSRHRFCCRTWRSGSTSDYRLALFHLKLWPLTSTRGSAVSLRGGGRPLC